MNCIEMSARADTSAGGRKENVRASSSGGSDCIGALTEYLRRLFLPPLLLCLQVYTQRKTAPIDSTVPESNRRGVMISPQRTTTEDKRRISSISAIECTRLHVYALRTTQYAFNELSRKDRRVFPLNSPILPAQLSSVWR